MPSLAPDIIGSREDGSLVFHEHFGLHDSDYYKRNLWKLSVYESAGICFGRNLICTFDNADGSLDLSLVDMLLKNYYGLS